jgi:predicted nucleic acid-binding protein
VTRILIDTNVYSAFKRNHEVVREEIRSADLIGISAIVLAELYSGFRLGSKERKNIKELDEFMEDPRVEALPFIRHTAFFYARIFGNLKKNATPIPTNDILIAASAMEHGLELLSFDRHFEKIEGLAFRMP